MPLEMSDKRGLQVVGKWKFGFFLCLGAKFLPAYEM